MFYLKASLNPTVLQTKKKKGNLDVMFLQLKTHYKKIMIRLIHTPLTHNINSDTKIIRSDNQSRLLI